MRPRKRSATGFLTSGYCTVTFGLKKWFRVTPMPCRMGTSGMALRRGPGASFSLMRPPPTKPRIPRIARMAPGPSGAGHSQMGGLRGCWLRGIRAIRGLGRSCQDPQLDEDGREHEVDDAQRQHDLPGHGQVLVDADARHGDPD